MYQFAFPGRYDNATYNGNGAIKATANQLVNAFAAEDKYICGICNGVSVLAWSRVNGQSLLEGKRVTGVRLRRKGRTFDAKADAEVLLAAGSINSPKLMELSGIGRASVLSELGVEVVQEVPELGENLQDHLQIRTVFRVSNARTLNTLANSLTGKATIGLQYLLTQSGPMSMAPSQFGMFTKSDPSKEMPDLEYHVQPLSTDKLGDPLHPFPAITVSVCNLRPESRGSTHAMTPDPAIQPEIKLNYLSTENDKRIAVTSVRQAREIMTADALKKYSPEEILPGPTVSDEPDLIKAVGDIATTIFHPVGTCRMGSDDTAVVDSELHVNGFGCLRVVDASIMPRIVSGNTASPVIMIAEKAADMIRSSRQ